ncbi:D-tagatose-bisphosphate aldolase, class II, non-catalytic subunit [Sodalis endosymbiont of Spalangia cameroni]|uniref:D-tagatose-bisphosphate aldolase, class II, non-catalytic subunit n=1 Tax=Sodalis praecaptivus TaxID=1239307 RepID=UPI0031F7E3D3
MQALLNLIKSHKAGESVGVFSVCSAHPWVLDAAVRHAATAQTTVLIEATSNQVNQFGGYTGLRPADFRDRVWQMAANNGLPRENVWLGGDHLGPNAWQDRPAEEAMILAEQMIAEYVQAGFRKIHLDCSMSCADDPNPLGDDEVARRAARLCAIAEAAWRTAGGEAPVYVIGTEVPVPGGAQETLHDVPPTTTQAAAATLAAHRDAWRQAGLDTVWARVIALVVQPGVEFDHQSVVHYRAASAAPLSQYIEHQPGLVFEAHSTDYQTADALRQLVRDHFAILKVGPALTFALREALFALAHIEMAWTDEPARSRLMARLDDVMCRQPAMWQRYYHGDARQQQLLRQYSLSDRVRYYWPQHEIEQAVDRLIANLRHRPAPLGLLSQYLPEQARLCLAGALSSDPQEWVYHAIDRVLCDYAQACRSEH